MIGLESDKELIRNKGIEVVDEMTGNTKLPKLCKENLDEVTFEEGVEAVVTAYPIHPPTRLCFPR